MPGFQVNVDHVMGRAPAIEKLQSFSEQLKEQYSHQVSEVQEDWRDDGVLDFSIKAMGMTISGVMETTDDLVSVNGKIPFAAVPFRGMIQNQIETELRRLLCDE